MSFSCEHCGFKNTEIQAAGSVQPQGSHYELRLTAMADFARQVVKADSATAKFIELDIEIPAGRGQLTNIEGLLSGIVDDLAMGQDARKEQDPDLHAKIEDIIAKGRAMLAGDDFPFRISLDDPAGNSWIAPDTRDGVGKWSKREYTRTPEQNAALGLSDTAGASGAEGVIPTGGQGRLDVNDELIPDEVYSFPASCPACAHPCTTHMKMVDVPHFKQVVLMSTVCDDCGYRSNDVKTGGEIPEKGRRITLHVEGATDLARDILKSESCALSCPELELTVNAGTLGGRFTTVEGLLTQVRDDLRRQVIGDDDAAGDSVAAEERARWDAFFARLDEAVEGRREFTVTLEDPLASSYVQSLADDPSQPDGQMTVEDYERTEEEEEELGLKDMNVENYGEETKDGDKTTKAGDA
jgi:zinc finger protein